MFKPLREYWRIPSVEVYFSVQSYVDAARIEHLEIVLQLEKPRCSSAVHFHVNDLTNVVDRSVLFHEEIKTPLEGRARELEHFGQQVVAEVIVILFDELLVLLVRLKAPQMQLLWGEVF